MSKPSRKLGTMISDLKIMKAELLPQDGDVQSQEEMKNMDDFQRKKYDLNVLMRDLRKDITRLQELKKEKGEDTRDQAVIKLQHNNDKALKQATDLWNDLKTILIKDEKKKKLEQGEMQTRTKIIGLLGEEIVELNNKNSRVKHVRTPDELQMENRREDNARQKREKRSNRRARRGRKGGKDGDGGGGADDLADELDAAQPVTQQEQEFMDKVDANVAEQDEILGQISKGLDELKDLGLEMGKTLAVQQAMIEEIDTKMDETIDKFKTANGRLKHILEQSGGLSRWCPMIICLCLLLGLIGYAIHVSKQ